MIDQASFPPQQPVSTRLVKKKGTRGKVETMPCDRLQKLVDLYSLEQVAKEFHHTKATVARWLHEGKMPKSAGLMCEALERRRGGEVTTFVITGKGRKEADEIRMVLSRLGIEIKEV